MAEETKHLRIVELRSENVKRLKAVAVRPQGNVVPVSGKNRQGKTSLLDSIGYLFEGKDAHPREVIRRGQTHALVLADLGDIIVERQWEKTDKGEVTTLVVRGADGRRFDKPQTMLEALYAHTTDPGAFMDADQKAQGKTLTELVPGLDFGPLDGKHSDLYEKRTKVNDAAKSAAARLKASPTPPAELPEKPVDVDQLLREQNELRLVERKNNEARQALRDLQRDVESATHAVEGHRTNVDRLERELELAKQAMLRCAEKLTETAGAYNAQQEVCAKLVDPVLGDLTAKISAAQTTNLWVERRTQRQALEAELEKLKKQSEEYSAAMQLLADEKTKRLGETKFPIAGLSINDDGATYNGFPLSEASGAEQLRVSVAVALARNPRLRVLRVKDGSKLDAEGMKLLEQLAAEYDAQVWIERVADKDPVGIVIEDGELAGPRLVKAEQADLGITLEGRGSGGAA